MFPPQVKIPMSSLCNGDIYRPLRIEIFDWDKNGKHQTMGVVSACVIYVWAVYVSCGRCSHASISLLAFVFHQY